MGDSVANEILLFCDQYEQMRGLDPDVIYTLRFTDKPISLTVANLRLLANAVLASSPDRGDS